MPSWHEANQSLARIVSKTKSVASATEIIHNGLIVSEASSTAWSLAAGAVPASSGTATAMGSLGTDVVEGAFDRWAALRTFISTSSAVFVPRGRSRPRTKCV